MTEVHQMNAGMALTGKAGGFVVEDDPTPSSLSDQEAGPVQASSEEEDNKKTRLCVSHFASLQNRDANRGPSIERVASDRETSGAMDESRSCDLEQKFDDGDGDDKNKKFGLSNGRAGMADKAARAVDRLEEPETPMTNGTTRCVLVAKCLTNSDASSGRIILPRVAVEANLPFVTAYRHYSLSVSDTRGRRYEFIIKSWANGTEHRRVFVLEQAAEFLRDHGVSVGDVIGICSDAAGGLVVEANTDAVREAIVSPRYGAGPFQLSGTTGPGKFAGLRDAQGAVPLVQSYSGRCIRSVHCTKPAGHPGFCSGPKAAAAAAAAAAQAHAAGAAAAARYRARRRSVVKAMMYGTNNHHAVDLGHQNQNQNQVEGASECSSDDLQLMMCGRPGAEEPEPEPEPEPSKPFTPQGAGIPLDLLPPHIRGFELAYIPSGGTVTKSLTPYDLSSRRVILNAQEVEEAMPCAQKHEACIVGVVDEHQCWHFLALRAWHSVAGRRGYLLEGAEDFLAARGAGSGDYLVLYRSRNHSPPRIELRQGGDGVKVMHPKSGKAGSNNLKFADLPILLHPQGISPFSDDDGDCDDDYDEGQHEEFTRSIRVRKVASVRSSMVCRRTNGCTKAAGHQGFCSGHKGFRKRHADPSDFSQHAFHQHAYAFSMAHGPARMSTRGKFGFENLIQPSDEDEYTPSFAKRARRENPHEYDPLLSLLQAAST
jgi:hypothetical protein